MILHDETATARLGAALAAIARPGDVITLSGPLGVGKTALARGFIAALGHDGEVPSPTFAIVQPYEDLDPPVWQVDLYRIEDPTEMAELGLDSAADAVTLVDIPALAISSTACRARVASGHPIWYLVPDGVVQYIAKHRLYSRGG